MTEIELVEQAWRDLEIAADAKGKLECASLTLPVEKVRALVADRRATTSPAPDVVTDAFVRRLLKEADFWSTQPSGDEIEALLKDAAAIIGASPTYTVTNAAASIAAMVAEWYDSAPHAPHIPEEIIAKRLSRFAAALAQGEPAGQAEGGSDRDALIQKYALACKRNAHEMAGMPITVIMQNFREFAEEIAAIGAGGKAAAEPYGYANLYRYEDGDFRLGGVDVYPTPEPEWAEFADDYVGPVALFPVSASNPPAPPSIPLDEMVRVLEQILACPAIADGSHNEPAWGDAETTEAESAARALLSRLRTAPKEGWRPIETAPKDGSRFLAWDGFSVFLCSYNRGWQDEPTCSGRPHTKTWMPLPAAPSPKAEGERHG